MKRYHLGILGISECRWTGSGKINTQTGETIIYSARHDDHHGNGVAIVMTKEASKSMEWTAVSGRIYNISQILVQVHENNYYTSICIHQRCKRR